MKELADLLGFGAPFIAAAGIYGLFMFLDSKASAPAKAAIVSWMDGEQYSNFDVKRAILSSFNSIYGQRLFSVKAFLRSAALSICVALIYLALYAGPFNRSKLFVGAGGHLCWLPSSIELLMG